MSNTFSEIIQYLVDSQVPISLNVIKSEVQLVGAFLGHDNNKRWRPHKIYVEGLELYPSIGAMDVNGKVKLPQNIPEWATTKCSVLAHEFSEAHYGYKHRDPKTNLEKSFKPAHKFGIVMENEVKNDIHMLLESTTEKVQYRPLERMKEFVEIDVPHHDHHDLIFEVGGHYEVVHMKEPKSISYYSKYPKEIPHKWVSDNHKFDVDPDINAIKSIIYDYNAYMMSKNSIKISSLFTLENNKVASSKSDVDRVQIENDYSQFFSSLRGALYTPKHQITRIDNNTFLCELSFMNNGKQINVTLILKQILDSWHIIYGLPK